MKKYDTYLTKENMDYWGEKILRIMSIDRGDVRTGIAVCDKLELLASPVCVIKESDFDLLIPKLIDQILQLKAEEVVIGYPKNLDGSIGISAQKSEKLIETLKKRMPNVNFVLWDERNTTISAKRALIENNKNSFKQKNIIDAVAATIILESYMHFKKRKKNNKQ